MSEWTRPVPNVNEETAPFWRATREHRLLLQRCAACGAVQHYYRAFCASCWSTDVQDEPASGAGSVWSFSVIWKNRAPGFDQLGPYVVAVVELDEGVRICCNLDVEEPTDAAIGMPVTIGFVDATESFSLPVARPAS